MFSPTAPGQNTVNGSSTMRPAERFEDEKRRIIDSCFTKKDTDGSLLESYITHIRITEDAAYPSSPPPPNSATDMKKPRLIIVAVRKSGRVRMHKARENSNGTFSIGKTWMLDDLSTVESYSGPTSGDPEDAQRKQWAGLTGFTITLGKPYYWQANSAKEKQYFLASLVKIYTKYTGGRTPQLIGFDEKEREQMLSSSSKAGSREPPPGYNRSREVSREQPKGPPGPQDLRKRPSRDAMARGPPPGVNTLAPGPPPLRQRPGTSGSTTSEPVNQKSQPNLRQMAAANPSQDSFSRTDDASSLPPRSRGGADGVAMPGRFPTDRSTTPTSQRTTTPPREVPPTAPTDNIPPVPAPLSVPPERRRPPISPPAEQPPPRKPELVESAPVAPAMSPRRREETPSSAKRSLERVRSKPDEVPEPSSAKTTDSVRSIAESLLSRTTNAPSTSTPPAESPVTSPIDSPPPSKFTDRPGLGPMIKKAASKGDIAAKFKSAARAANAFKPRAGGAAERFMALKEKESAGPDGITEVVPAPGLRTKTPDSSTSGATTPAITPMPGTTATPVPTEKSGTPIPEVTITSVQSEKPATTEAAAKQDKLPIPEKSKVREKRSKASTEMTVKQLAALGLEPGVLDGRGTDFITLLDEFGWSRDGVHSKNIDHMKEEVERSLNAVQVGSWMTRLDDEDERVEAIKKGLDMCIAECEELDGLLTLYSVELGTLDEDIAYIEAQSQGLQVQAANQKLLQAELQSLLETISISSTQLGPLRDGSLESSNGIEEIESSLVMLFKAMVTIDPSITVSNSRQGDNASIASVKTNGIGNSEIGSMQVLQEKKDIYKSETAQFLQRLRPFLLVKFAAALDDVKKALDREKEGGLSRRAGKAKLDPRNHDLAREQLWKYSPILLFTREINRREWDEIMKIYEATAKTLYQDEFRDVMFAWKRGARKPTGDEGEILFTSQIEKQSERIATTARKLTVKRSGTLAKIRSPILDPVTRSAPDKSQEGRMHPFEVFKGLIDEMVPLIFMEQNFVVDFFHVSSLEQQEFPDLVAAARPGKRRGTDLRRPKIMDPDRGMAKKVVQSMEELFSFFAGDMQNLVDWCLQADPLQGVGVLAALESKLSELEETSQEFLARTLQKLHLRLVGLFNKFLDEQLRAIEDTKVKINKRKGVIGFMRIFPSFSAALETMLAGAEELEIRETVNNAYVRIIKTMFESLKVIARENPTAQAGAMMGDPEDKEALNYEILLIENMNHFLEEVDTRDNPVLEDAKQTASQEMDDHMTLYLGAVIRRPLGKILDFIESTESLLLSLPAGQPPSSVALKPSHAKATFKKLLVGYDGREIRRGVETLKKRVEKHFGDADDPNLSRSLVTKVLANCEKYYEDVENRIFTISRDVYDGDVALEWSRADVTQAFRR